MTITEFARERNIKEQTVFKYMYRNGIKYDKSKGLTDEQLEKLDKKYPLPKPVYVVNGLPADEERKLRQDLEEALKRLASAQDKIVELTEKASVVQLLEDKSAQQEQEIERLKSRNLWERIINKI